MALPEERTYTFADIMDWGEDVRVELIDGTPCMMSPPTRRHQEVLSELHRQLANFLVGKSCRVYPAPFGVRLFSKKEDPPAGETTLLEPDITVVCDREKLDKYGCKGAPDLIVEILSPSTRRRDRFEKFHLYRRAGVREYWLVDPDKALVQTMVLEDGRYPAGEVYTARDRVPVTVLEGCVIDLTTVFPEDGDS